MSLSAGMTARRLAQNSKVSWFSKTFGSAWNGLKASKDFYGGKQFVQAGKHIGMAGANFGAGVANIFNPAASNTPYFRNAFRHGRSAAGSVGGWFTARDLAGLGGQRTRAAMARTAATGGAAWGISSLMRDR